MSEGNGKIPDLTGNGNYSVGYGKPPTDTRFKPGNQAARSRRGGVRIWKRIQRELLKKVPDGENAGKRVADVVARTYVGKCEAGDMQALKELIEREEGKVPDRIAGPDGGPPVVKVLRGVSMDDLL